MVGARFRSHQSGRELNEWRKGSRGRVTQAGGAWLGEWFNHSRVSVPVDLGLLGSLRGFLGVKGRGSPSKAISRPFSKDLTEVWVLV